jgi:membrane protease YdiL (CAAX protease family)
MYDSNSKGISYTAGFFMLIAFVVAGFLLGTVISIPVWTSMTGTPFSAMTKELNNPAYANAMKVIQVITTVFGFFFPTILTAFLLNRKPIHLLGFRGKIKIEQVGLVIAIMIAGLFVSSGLAYFNNHVPIPTNWKETFDQWESNYNEQVVALVGLDTFPGYLLGLLIMAVLPAICEETLFRGGLQNFLTRSTKLPWLSIIIVSILFSAVHGSYYGFLSRFFLGAILGLVYLYSGKIWLNILGHFLNNALAVTAIYVYTLQGKSLKEALDANTDSYWGIFALPVVIVLFILFQKVSKRDPAKTESLPPGGNTSGDIFPS